MLMKKVLFLDKIYVRGKSLKRILQEQSFYPFLWMKICIFLVSFDCWDGEERAERRDGEALCGGCELKMALRRAVL